jgi:hypothetical protein
VEYRIKNTSKAAQGIYTLGGLVFVPPGATRSVVPLEISRVRKQPFFEVEEPDAELPAVPEELISRFDHDGDGKPGGSLPRSADGQGSFSDEREEQPKPKAPAKRRRKRRAKAKK